MIIIGNILTGSPAMFLIVSSITELHNLYIQGSGWFIKLTTEASDNEFIFRKALQTTFLADPSSVGAEMIKVALLRRGECDSWHGWGQISLFSLWSELSPAPPVAGITWSRGEQGGSGYRIPEPDYEFNEGRLYETQTLQNIPFICRMQISLFQSSH